MMSFLTKIFPSWLDHGVYHHPKAKQSPSPVHLPPRILEAVEVAEVLCHTPCHPFAVMILVILSRELLSIFEVLRDWLFR